MKKTVLITGALGTIGIFTINKLLEETDYNIIGIDNCSSNPYERIKEIKQTPNFKFMVNNPYLYERNPLEIVFGSHEIDTILHLGGSVGVANSFKKPLEYMRNNIEFTNELLEFAVKCKVKRFIFASSSTVYGNIGEKRTTEDMQFGESESLYTITKKAGEDLVNFYHRKFDLNTIIFRYYNVFAPIKYYSYKPIIPLFIEKIMNDEQLIIYNNGRQKRHYVPIDNIVYANKLAIETTNEKCIGETFNITIDEEPVSLLDLVKMLYKYCNKKPNYVLVGERSKGDIDYIAGDNTKAKNLLGYRVVKTFEEGIKDCCEWFLKQNRDKNV